MGAIGARGTLRKKLGSGLPPPLRAEGSPNLAGFTRGVSCPGAPLEVRSVCPFATAPQQPVHSKGLIAIAISRLLLEATTGFEPVIAVLQTAAFPLGYVAFQRQSGRWDSNPRPSPWQGDALPLSHARIVLVVFGSDAAAQT